MVLSPPPPPLDEKVGSTLKTKTRITEKKEINSPLGKTALKKYNLNDFSESF